MKTLATHTLELVMAELIHDYLVATQTGKADAAIPKRMMDYIKEPERPVLIITAKEESTKGSPRRSIKINPILATWAKSEEPGAAVIVSQTTQDEASRIMRAIEDRLCDREAFGAWLLAQSEERRAGWSLMKIVHEGMAPIMRHEETRGVFYGYQMMLHLSVSQKVP